MTRRSITKEHGFQNRVAAPDGCKFTVEWTELSARAGWKETERLHRSSSDLQVLVVSRGDLEINRMKVAEHRLTFPVVVQHRWEVSREYGIFATPVAYLIDEQGVIVAEVAVGGDAIFALAKGKDK